MSNTWRQGEQYACPRNRGRPDVGSGTDQLAGVAAATPGATLAWPAGRGVAVLAPTSLGASAAACPAGGLPVLRRGRRRGPAEAGCGFCASVTVTVVKLCKSQPGANDHVLSR